MFRIEECEDLQGHRLYHAIGARCPCMIVVIPPWTEYDKGPTLKLDDVKNRRWKIIE